MIPLPDRHKSNPDNTVTSIAKLPSLSLPYEPAAVPPDLADIVAAWSTLPDPIRAGIVAMVKASGKGGDR